MPVRHNPALTFGIENPTDTFEKKEKEPSLIVRYLFDGYKPVITPLIQRKSSPEQRERLYLVMLKERYGQSFTWRHPLHWVANQVRYRHQLKSRSGFNAFINNEHDVLNQVLKQEGHKEALRYLKSAQMDFSRGFWVPSFLEFGKAIKASPKDTLTLLIQAAEHSFKLFYLKHQVAAGYCPYPINSDSPLSRPSLDNIKLTQGWEREYALRHLSLPLKDLTRALTQKVIKHSQRVSPEEHLKAKALLSWSENRFVDAEQQFVRLARLTQSMNEYQNAAIVASEHGKIQQSIGFMSEGLLNSRDGRQHDTYFLTLLNWCDQLVRQQPSPGKTVHTVARPILEEVAKIRQPQEHLPLVYLVETYHALKQHEPTKQVFEQLQTFLKQSSLHTQGSESKYYKDLGNYLHHQFPKMD